MPVPSDFKDLLRALNAHRVRYLIIGSYAVMHYAEPRFTKDLDLWVEPTPGNARRVYAALADFGAPLAGIAPSDFSNPKLVYQIGVAPVRADIMMSAAKMPFLQAWKNRKRVRFDGLMVNLIGKRDLMRLKRAANRPADRLDLVALSR